MRYSDEIFSKLTQNAAVKAIVGDRVYPVMIKATGVPAPYVIYQGIGSEPITTHGEAATNGFDLVQFACFGTDYTQASDLRAAVVAALDNQPLSSGAKPTLMDDGRDDYDAAVDFYRCDADFLI